MPDTQAPPVDTSYTFTDYFIGGSLNNISSYQEGHGGLIGHS